jgi:carboxylate-amine ligase
LLEALTLGVEEEFLVVDRATRALVPRAHELLPRAQDAVGDDVSPELNLCQIEIDTPVCATLDEVRHHLGRLRSGLTAAGEPLGIAVAATATHPFSSWRSQRIDPRNDRYSRLDEAYQLIAREQVICGCHVHVAIDDPDLAVRTMNRVTPWLPVLLALSSNSPYWQSVDTGYASYRLEVWQRWPTSGVPPILKGRCEYDDMVETLRRIEAIEDETFLYWFARPSARYPTLEIRVCDTCLSVDDTVAIAGLARALVWTCATEVVNGAPHTAPGREIVEAAVWRAARYGLDERLVSPADATVRPAGDVVDELLAYVGHGLDAHGDAEAVTDLIAQLMARGTGSARQRLAFEQRERWDDVIDMVLDATLPAGPDSEQPLVGTTVDRDRGPGDEAGVRGAEERNDPAEVVR